MSLQVIGEIHARVQVQGAHGALDAVVDHVGGCLNSESQ